MEEEERTIEKKLERGSLKNDKLYRKFMKFPGQS
jgi:hypothetical protein